MNYTEVKNPKWANEEKTMIICDVNFDHLLEESVPFICVPKGDYPHSHEIYQRCVDGEFGRVGDFVPEVVEELPV